MKWKWKSTKERRIRIEDFWKNRVGRKFGISKVEYMRAIYGEVCDKWNKEKYQKRLLELKQATRWISNVEKTRNIRCIYTEKEMLDDRSLINPIITFGQRIFSGWLIFQPDNEMDAQKFRNRLDIIAEGLEKSGEIAVENFILQQKILAKINNNY